MMKWKPRLGVKHGERGNVVLLVTVAMTSLLGFLAMATDVGMVYLQQEKMFNALDAGALAGIQNIFLGKQAAEDTARLYAQQNGVDPSQVQADTTDLTVDLWGKQSVPMHFAQIVGWSQMTITAHVQAAAGTLVSGSGFVPLGVPQQPFVYGQVYTLSLGAGNGYSGNYGFLDFDTISAANNGCSGGGGASDLEQYIERGYPGTISIGNYVCTKPGNNTGPVASAVNERINEDSQSMSCQSFSTAQPGCKRIMYLPVVNTLQVNGKKPVQIMGFAAFYLEGLAGSGGHQQILGRFIQTVTAGSIGQGPNFGLYAVHLTH
jgi:hypothetical protein